MGAPNATATPAAHAALKISLRFALRSVRKEKKSKEQKNPETHPHYSRIY